MSDRYMVIHIVSNGYFYCAYTLINSSGCRPYITLMNMLYFFKNFVCLFVLGFYGPVNNEVMLSWSANGGAVPGQA